MKDAKLKELNYKAGMMLGRTWQANLRYGCDIHSSLDQIPQGSELFFHHTCQSHLSIILSLPLIILKRGEGCAAAAS